MMLARLHSGNWNIIALQNAYHGASPYARQLTSHVSSLKEFRFKYVNLKLKLKNLGHVEI